MNAIAGLYDQGEGVPRNPAMAATWYRRSAERGDSVGQLNLGDMYSRGAGLPLDRVRAYFWLSLAAAQGNAWSADKKLELARTMTAAEIAAAQSRYEALRHQPPVSP
jgi:TPR repeat protein